ncbi:MAG: hypothetical protein GX596_12670 [Propionibacterium sp.]|nr:hypothetical protein [Propionibacterium sp.]
MTQPAGARPRSPWWAAAVAAALLALALVALMWPGDDERFPETVAPVRPSGSIWDELPTRSADPAPEAPIVAQADVTDCPAVDEVRVSPDVAGFVVGGGLVFPVPADWEPTREVAHSLTDEQGVQRFFGSTALRSTMSVGEVRRAEGFMDVEEAAWNVFHCHLASTRFPSNNMGYDRLASRAVEVDGAEAWRVRADVSSIRSGAGGTMFDIVAVEAGSDDALGVFLSVAMETNGLADDDVAAAIEGLSLHR